MKLIARFYIGVAVCVASWLLLVFYKQPALNDTSHGFPGPVPSGEAVCSPPSWVPAAFQYIRAHQHPADCDTALFMMAGEPMQWNMAQRESGEQSEVSPAEGYGSVFSLLSQALLVAAGETRTLLINISEWSYGGTEDCVSRLPRETAKWDCLFRSIASCGTQHFLDAWRQDAAAAEQLLPLSDRLPWMVSSARYVHRDVLRLRPGETLPNGQQGFMMTPYTPMRLPASLRDRSVGHVEWLAAVRAYLHSSLSPSTTADLKWYGGLPPLVSSAVSDPQNRVIGLHVRLRDRGGGGAQLVSTWEKYAALIRRISDGSSAKRILLATDSNEPQLEAMAKEFASREGYYLRVVPRKFLQPGDAHVSTAAFLQAHPAYRYEATLDVIAALDLLGRCNYIVGRPLSALFRIAASLQLARGCQQRDNVDEGLPAPLWSIDHGGPVELKLEDDGFQPVLEEDVRNG